MSKSSFCCIMILILTIVIAIPVLSQTRVGKLGIGVDGSMQYLLGAGTTNSSPAFGEGVSISYSVMENFGIRGKFCYSPVNWKSGSGNLFSADIMSLNLYAGSNLMPNSTFNIFPFIGGGLAVFDPRDNNGGRAIADGKPVLSFDYHIIGGVSLDWFLNELWSANLMGEYVLTNSQYYAGNAEGNMNKDSFMRVSIQVQYYFFNSAFITKVLNSLRERPKSK
jgi:hypothetical protein